LIQKSKIIKKILKIAENSKNKQANPGASRTQNYEK
jgi:hypothetical protein